jgi:tetratricopeptide (TPR) repeat protein
MGLGVARFLNGEYSRAEAVLRAAIPETEQGGFPREAAIMHLMLGLAVLSQGHPAQALECLEESVRRYRNMQFTGELGWALGGLVLAQDAMGQAEAARVTLLEALCIAEKTHSMFAINTSLPALVYLLKRRGLLETALLSHRVALRQPMPKNSHWYHDLIGRELDADWAALPPDQQACLDASALPLDPFTLIPQVLPLLASQL